MICLRPASSLDTAINVYVAASLVIGADSAFHSLAYCIRVVVLQRVFGQCPSDRCPSGRRLSLRCLPVRGLPGRSDYNRCSSLTCLLGQLGWFPSRWRISGRCPSNRLLSVRCSSLRCLSGLLGCFPLATQTSIAVSSKEAATQTNHVDNNGSSTFSPSSAVEIMSAPLGKINLEPPRRQTKLIISPALIKGMVKK